MNKTVTVYTVAISKVRKEVENCFLPKLLGHSRQGRVKPNPKVNLNSNGLRMNLYKCRIWVEYIFVSTI